MIEVYNKKYDVIVRIYNNNKGKRIEVENNLGICNASTFEKAIEGLRIMGAL